MKNEPEYVINIYNGRYEDGKKILIQIPLNNSQEILGNSRFFSLIFTYKISRILELSSYFARISQ